MIFETNWEISFPEIIKFSIDLAISKKMEESDISRKVIDNHAKFESDLEFLRRFGFYLMKRWYNSDIELSSGNFLSRLIDTGSLPLIQALIDAIFSLWKQDNEKGKPLI